MTTGRTMELFPAAESRCGLEVPRHPQSLDCMRRQKESQRANPPRERMRATREECRGRGFNCRKMWNVSPTWRSGVSEQRKRKKGR